MGGEEAIGIGGGAYEGGKRVPPPSMVAFPTPLRRILGADLEGLISPRAWTQLDPQAIFQGHLFGPKSCLCLLIIALFSMA